LNSGTAYSVNKVGLTRFAINQSKKERSEMNALLLAGNNPCATGITTETAQCAFKRGVLHNRFPFTLQIDNRTFRKGTIL
jgi:hypothetical protein